MSKARTGHKKEAPARSGERHRRAWTSAPAVGRERIEQGQEEAKARQGEKEMRSKQGEKPKAGPTGWETLRTMQRETKEASNNGERRQTLKVPRPQARSTEGSNKQGEATGKSPEERGALRTRRRRTTRGGIGNIVKGERRIKRVTLHKGAPQG